MSDEFWVDLDLEVPEQHGVTFRHICNDTCRDTRPIEVATVARQAVYHWNRGWMTAEQAMTRIAFAAASTEEDA